MREKGRAPETDDPPTAKPGTRMLLIPTCPADPLRLAEEQVERLRRERAPRPVKTDKKKPKRRGGIGTPRAHNRKVLSGEEK